MHDGDESSGKTRRLRGEARTREGENDDGDDKDEKEEAGNARGG